MNEFQALENSNISPPPVLSHCTKVFATYHRLFSWFPSNIILDIDPNTYQLLQVDPSNPRYFTWYFNFVVLTGIIGSISCIFAILQIKTISSAQIAVAAGLLTMCILFVATSYQLIIHIQEIIHGFHSFEQLILLLTDIKISCSSRSLWNSSFWNTVSTLFQLITVVFAVIPFILAPAAIYANVDPFIQIIPNLFPNEYHSLKIVQLTILFIRLALSVICYLEACRFFAVYFPTLLLIIEYRLKCIHMIFTCTSPLLQDSVYGLTFFRWYQILQVVDKVSAAPWSTLFPILMGDGSFILVVCNVATLKFHGIIPIEVYWLMPTVCVASSILHYYLLPLLIQVRANSERLLNQRRHQNYFYCYVTTKSSNGFCIKGFWNRKYYWRKLKSIRPMEFACGPFFKLTNIKAQYFYDVFLRSVDGIMLKL